MPGAREVAAAAAGYDGPVAGSGLVGRESVPVSGQPGHRRRRERPQWPATAALLAVPAAVALVVYSYQLGRPSLWRDEAYTLEAASRSPAQIFRLLQHTDAVNSAYYFLVHPVIAALGTSAVALRLLSVLAMAVAASVTAVIGRRLARAGELPVPFVTGLLAGLLLAASPEATSYAQEARSYAMVTMFATIATYLLLRGLESNRWRWWAGYAAAVAAMGLLNLLSLLLLAAHGAALLIMAARLRRSAGEPAAGQGQPTQIPARRWLAAAAATVAVLTPLIALGMSQSGQVGWLKAPGLPTIQNLVNSFSGSRTLLPLVAALALGGVAASLTFGRRGPLDVATVAGPWLVLPPVVLITVSQVHPLFDARYVVYILPALALLTAAGLAWVTRLVMTTSLGRGAGRLAWLPAVALVAVFAVLVAGPQRSERLPGSRPDNLRRASALMAANARSGDAVVYLPANKRVVSMGYPGPFRRLRDVALEQTPLAAGNLIGKEVTPQVLQQRFAHVSRVWVITGGLHVLSAPKSPMDHAKVALLRSFHLISRWRTGKIWLSLYARG